VELIEYIESENFAEYTCLVDIEYFKSQIMTQSGDSITLSYGSDVAIKFTSNDIVQIVALSEE
jgi:hypothetical protein